MRRITYKNILILNSVILGKISGKLSRIILRETHVKYYKWRLMLSWNITFYYQGTVFYIDRATRVEKGTNKI